MKKILSVILAAMMAASLAACGSSGGASSSQPAAPASSAAGSTAANSEAASAPAEGAITSAADLTGKKIGVQAGTTGEVYVQENVADAELGSYKSGMDAALDLKNGKIDAVVLDELPAKSIVAQNDDLMILDADLATEEYAIAVKKGNTELLEAINATIARMQEDGTYESLVNAFMPAGGDSEIKIPDAVGTEGDKTIKMGTNAAFKPFEYVEGTEVVGFDISMAQQIAQDMGAKLQVEDMAFDSLISALDAGAIDFVAAGMTATEERRQSVDFSDPYYSSKQVIILKK
ncbi:transporter substrate-binding domain-containing protein [Anaerotruncus colihominis]|uniref:transporter substrate-binding domain-containing protein n=1 Tax=Anaerotruncus colihominis TaxID=169435 RepID=UPI002941F1A1|nr:transporter substrate-binding domain-containing protein [Anaerotruncus colihominis]